MDAEPKTADGSKRIRPVLNDEIREDLDSALADDSINLNFEFAFERSYRDAPNPALNLADLGLVGLPLSARDAEAIKTRAVQAPFGMGERTVVDTSVRDTWELDARQVYFANPHWKAFVDKAALEVCQALGVNYAASKPRCDLYKLLLYETGSHFLPHVDTEKADGMFATVIIVLPSQFTGGAAHLSHRHLSRVYDCSPQSLLNTTVLAWYTDALHEIKPITSGYRLALAYNLVHTTTNLRPALPTSTAVIDKLTQVLDAWNNDTDGPDKLMYLLGDHRYSQASLSASALKGADAQKVAMVQAVAQNLGIGVGLANVHCWLSGSAADQNVYRPGRVYDDSDSEYDEDAIQGFAEVHDQTMTIKHLVDLDGEIIADQVEFDEENETIPAYLTEEVESWEHEKQDYEGYRGNGAGSLERSAVVCALANKLKDLSLWQRALLTCGFGKGLATVGHQVKLAAIEIFGFSGVQSSLELMLEADVCNLTTHQFLNLLSRGFWNPVATSVERVVEVYREAQLWAISKKDTALRTLKTPAADECAILIDATLEKGEAGYAFLREILLPQLQSLGTTEFLVSFARSVFSAENLASGEHKHQITTDLFKAAIAKISVLPPTPIHEDLTSFIHPTVSSVPEDRSAEVRMIAQACFDLKSNYLVGDIVKRILEATGAAADSAQKEDTTIYRVTTNGGFPGSSSQNHASAEAAGTHVHKSTTEECAQSVMLPLVAFFAERRSTNPSDVPDAVFEPFQATSAVLFLDWIAANPSSFTQLEMAMLIKATALHENFSLFMSTIVPRLKSTNLPSSALQVIVQEMVSCKADFVVPENFAGPSLDSIITDFAEAFAKVFTPEKPANVTGALDWCVIVGQTGLIHLVLEGATRPALLDTSYINNVLVPSLPLLRAWGSNNGALSSVASGFQRIMAAWVDRVLGASPTADTKFNEQVQALKRWTCKCAHCSSARRFINATSASSSMNLDGIGAQNRRHVEDYLSFGLVTYSTIRYSGRQVLAIQKSAALERYTAWKAVQGKGLDILKHISQDEVELKDLLAEEYGRIMAAVGAKPLPTTQAGPAPAPGSFSTHGSMTTSLQRPAPEAASAQQPPAKKRKVLAATEADIIDLT